MQKLKLGITCTEFKKKSCFSCTLSKNYLDLNESSIKCKNTGLSESNKLFFEMYVAEENVFAAKPYGSRLQKQRNNY